MSEKDFYTSAHLIVAAIRILEHQKNLPPSVEAICEMLSFSSEQGYLICKKLADMKIVEFTEGGYGTRLFIRDHLKIEDIPKDSKEKSLQEEIEQFQSSRKELKQKITSVQAQKAERQKQLFAELESKLKKKLDTSERSQQIRKDAVNG